MLIESTDTVTIGRAEYRQLLADRERLAALEQQLAALKRQVSVRPPPWMRRVRRSVKRISASSSSAAVGRCLD